MEQGWTERLLDWFEAHRRVLPWRDEPTPYRVLVSEFMLQQTQVATVLPYFSRFLEAFPTVEALASASVDEVLKRWEGLGYYARARRLHQCAQTICAEGFPQDAAGLARLPGIGPYTAAAVASIAFDRPVPVVDGNVLRFRSRMLADEGSIDRQETRRRHYERLLPAVSSVRSPSRFNQAMMELGALVCHPTSPDCASCPVSGDCVAHAQGRETAYPVRTERAAVPHLHVAVAIIEDGGEMLILRRSEEQMLGGLWEFPGGKLEPGETAAEAAVRETLEETGLNVAARREVAVVRHAYSHFRITMHAFACALESPREQLRCDRPSQWIRPAQVRDFAFPKANHKIFAALGIAD